MVFKLNENKTAIFFIWLLIVQVASIAQDRYFQKVETGGSFNSSQAISFIKEDNNRQLWILNFNGLIHYDGSEYKNINVSGIPRSILIGFHIVNKKVFVQDLLGRLFYVEDDSLRPHSFNEQISQFDPKGPYWVVADSNAIYYSIRKYEGATLVKINTTTQEISLPLNENDIYYNGLAFIIREGKRPIISIVKDSSVESGSAKYFKVFNEKFELLNGVKISNNRKALFPASYTLLPNQNYLISLMGRLFECNSQGFIKELDYGYSITGLLTDSNGGLWVSTDTGLHYYRDGKINSDNKTVSLKNTFCVVKEEDFQGGIWIYSRKDGLIRISNPSFSHYHEKNFLNDNNVRFFSSYNDTLFYGGNSPRLYYINQKNMDTGSYKLPSFIGHKSPFNSIHILEDEKKIWLSKRGSLIYRHNGEWDTVSLKKLNIADSLSKIYLEPSNRSGYEFAGFRGKEYFLGNADSIHFVSDPIKDRIRKLLVLQDSVIIGTRQGIIVKPKGNNGYKKYAKYTGDVFTLQYFDSKVWGTAASDGLFVLDNARINQIFWEGKPIHGGILFNQEDKHLWLLRNKQSFRIDSFSDTLVKLIPFQPVPQFSTGYPSFNKKSVFFRNRKNGVLRVDFNTLSDSMITPSVFFKEIRFDDSRMSVTDSVFSLEYTNNSIRISFAAANYSNTPLQYRYRFGASNNTWEYTSENEILLVDLPPNEYKLEVQSRLINQSWGIKKNLSFTIHPPVWKTWWFITLEVVVGIFVVLVLMRLRIRQINHKNSLVVENLLVEQQALRAKLDPHYVFNIISSAQSLIFKEKKEKAIDFLQLFSRQLRSVLDQTDKKVLTLEEDLTLLKDYIELERFRLGESFDYFIHLDHEINPQKERILSMLIQPFVENAIQHGLRAKEGDGKLSIQIELKSDFLKILIEDDGIGREAASKLKRQIKIKKKSYGIEICQKRLAIHNAGFKTDAIQFLDKVDSDGKANGTQVIITMKRITE